MNTKKLAHKIMDQVSNSVYNALESHDYEGEALDEVHTIVWESLDERDIKETIDGALQTMLNEVIS